jgi:BirA family biotin operon repressor/biotin-[acetyl-CoA-carboxylase] ligase
MANWHIHSFETLSSTQDVAKQYLNEGRPLPLVVQADMQTASRGRSGNKWISSQGNLLSSAVIPLQNVSARDAGQYSFLAAISLIKVLLDLGVTDIQNKWPNDVLVGGKKIAGILLESDISTDGFLKSLIIGFGINLVASPEGAVNVQALIHKIIQPLEFLDQLNVEMQTQLDIMAVEGFAPIRKTWLSHAYGLGTEIRVRLPTETFFGEFLGLDDVGALLVKVADEPTHRIIHSGEVFFG